jgi:PKD repeat protein
MRRNLLTSASFSGLLIWSLTGCGGGDTGTGQTPKPPAPTATNAPAATTPPATMAKPADGAAGEKPAGEEEEAPLLAWADADTDEGAAPLVVQFSADIEGGKAPLKIKWTFGDGTESTETNPKHTYEKAGKFRADLEVADSAGDSDSDYIEVEVTEKK